jgi:signal recognition particle receptor subunit beta
MSDVTARILLWGIDGAGKTTTLETIHAKLRPELRGELRREPTRLDPTIHFEALPIMLGEVGGVGTRIELVAVPGAEDQAMTRKQLLDEVDGIVLCLDCAPERIEENWSAIDELRSALADYGRRLEETPIVLQYNKRDVADPFAIEDLHRRIGLDQSAVFETIATTGHGVLSTLTTISKHVVRARRAQSSPQTAGAVAQAEAPPAAAGAPTPTPASDPAAAARSHDILEAAILAEADEHEGEALEADLALDLSPPSAQLDWQATAAVENEPKEALAAELRIVSVGHADLDGEGGLRLPVVLGDDQGQTRSVVLSLRIDPLPHDGGD